MYIIGISISIKYVGNKFHKNNVRVDLEERACQNFVWQCCGAGAGGAEIVLGPGAGAGAENKFQ